MFEKVEWKSLGDVIISLKTWLNPRQNFKLNTEDATNYYITIREIKWWKITITDKTDKINNQALNMCNNRSNLEIWDVLFSWTWTIWETLTIKQSPTNWNIKEWVYAIKPNRKFINSDFLKYLFKTNSVKNKYSASIVWWTVKSIPMADLRKIELPIPSLEKQQEIVAILDKFDTLVNDLSTGLPAELEARRKQYEYYREKLLTFTTLKE